MPDTFTSDPISYTLELIDDERTTEKYLLMACLKWMSHDQIRDMLDENELSPRFFS